MKQVTMESVKQRIAYIEDLNERGVGTKVERQQFELACLRELVAVTEQRDAVVVENVAMKSFRKSLEDIRSSLIGGGHGYMAVSDMQAQNAVLDVVFDEFDEIDTPATDAAIAALRAEVLAEAIPDGYALVPQEMHLPAESMEGICFHCGDGGHQFGEFTDGTLFVGEVDYGDGKKVYGLHIATADYPEEGCATICEFASQLRESKGEVRND